MLQLLSPGHGEGQRAVKHIDNDSYQQLKVATDGSSGIGETRLLAAQTAWRNFLAGLA